MYNRAGFTSRMRLRTSVSMDDSLSLDASGAQLLSPSVLKGAFTTCLQVSSCSLELLRHLFCLLFTVRIGALCVLVRCCDMQPILQLLAQAMQRASGPSQRCLRPRKAQ